MTINRKQIVSEVIELCGGRNVFAGLAPLVPQVAVESVLAADPEAIFTADEHGSTALLRRDPDAPALRRVAPASAPRGGAGTLALRPQRRRDQPPGAAHRRRRDGASATRSTRCVASAAR